MNGIATYSITGRVLDRLRQLDMNTSQLARIACAFDYPCSTALLSLVLSGKREFTAFTGQKILELTKDLCELKDFYDKQGIPLAWGASETGAEHIALLLVRRRADVACAELDAADAAKA